MKFYQYIKEGVDDKDPKLEFEKAVFDLLVAIKEREFMKTEKAPMGNVEANQTFVMKKVSLVKKIITTAEKVKKMAEDGGYKISDEVKKLLDEIPSKEEVEDVKSPIRQQ